MWTNDYVGLPWRERGRDRTGVDCWGLVRLVLAERCGIDLPSYAEDYASPLELAEVTALIEGRPAGLVGPVCQGCERPFDLILLRDGGLPSHIGIVAGPRLMLHVRRGGDSVVEAYDGAPWRNRVVGFYRAGGSHAA